MTQKRLDVLLVERGLCKSREQAQAFILAGTVWTLQKRLEKPSIRLDPNTPLEVRTRTPRFSSRAGEKLQHALNHFKLNISGRICLDIGASHGGFTDCLLKAGAAHVFAVDVGYGQLDQKLREDKRVSCLEKTNARYLTLETLLSRNPVAKNIDFLSIDVSFISLKKIIAPLRSEIPNIREWVMLFKPQFEVERKSIGKKGVVKNQEAISTAFNQFNDWMVSQGFILHGGPENSPLPGKKSGNLEYLVHYELA